jgi:sugar fermentation stimulation protein A
MQFEPQLIHGVLIQRYKRFLADVRLDSGVEITAHCPNPGSMKTCAEPGWGVWVSPANSPKRKLKWTLELIDSPTARILVNTQRPNALVAESVLAQEIQSLTGYSTLKREVSYGANSRIDLLLSEANRPDCYVEIKSVSMLHKVGVAAFPDSVTKRGTKHLEELVGMVKNGHRAVQFFLVSRTDVDCVVPAESIDPTYAKTLRWAADQGVEVVAHRTIINEQELHVGEALPVLL